MAALLIAAPSLAACGDDSPTTIVEEADTEQEAELTSGEPFEATARVVDVLSPHAFVLLDTLVVSRTPLSLKADDRVRVTGEITDATAPEVERLLGIDFEASLEDKIDDDLIVIASDVDIVGDDDE